jgi:hypothetical protein
MYDNIHHMCPTISLRVTDKMKTDINHFKRKVDWNCELRQFIEKKVEEERKKELLEELESLIADLPTASDGTVKQMVREDRDSH